jgi:hypothetical protein
MSPVSRTIEPAKYITHHNTLTAPNAERRSLYMSTTKIRKFIIKGPVDKFDNEQLYWNDHTGWGCKETALVLTESQRDFYLCLPHLLPYENKGMEEITA